MYIKEAFTNQFRGQYGEVNYMTQIAVFYSPYGTRNDL